MTPVLRAYQSDAVEAAMESAIGRRKNGVIVMPTGSGKSLVIAGLANRLTGNIVVLQPTKEILEQNYRKLYEFGGADLGIYSAAAGKKKRAKITFATIGTIINRQELFDDTAAILVDECHVTNAKEGRYKKFIERLGVPTIGLTASPYRMATSLGGQVVEAKFLHRTRPRIFDHISYIVQNDDLHSRGFLCPMSYIRDESYDPYAIALNSTGLNYRDEALAAYNKAQGTCRKIADTVIGRLKDCRHFLIFVAFVEESKEIAALLGEAGVSIAHVDGETPKAERERIISGFRGGEIKAVSNVGVLTTGFDFPALDAIVLGRPTMSLPLYYQMVGRGVRVADGKIGCKVFDLCGNVDRFGRPDEWHIEAGNGEKHRLRAGKRYLTGFNFVSGRDLEKQRERRAAAKQAAKEAAAGDPVVTFGKHTGKKVSEVPADYMRWCVENFGAGRWKDIFAAELQRRASAPGVAA